VLNDDIHFPRGALADIAVEAARSLTNEDHRMVASLHPEVDNWTPKGQTGTLQLRMHCSSSVLLIKIFPLANE
jgi:hypothetical protein